MRVRRGMHNWPPRFLPGLPSTARVCHNRKNLRSCGRRLEQRDQRRLPQPGNLNQAMAQRKNRRSQNQPAVLPASIAEQVPRGIAHSPVARALTGALLISAVVGAVYASALSAPLVFDDIPTIVDNASIRHLWPPVGTPQQPGPLRPAAQLPTSGRPLVNLSFALNYAIGGESPAGYRWVNVGLHISSALLLWGIVRRTLVLDYFKGRFSQVAGSLGLITALLWSVHPLLTDAVEYVTQRTELVMAICYLATLYASLRYWAAETTRSRVVWLGCAALACAAGMASKEVMVSAPAVVLLFERTFVSGSFRQALKKSWRLYVALCLGWGVLLALNLGGPRTESTGFGHQVTAFSWWLTQTRVLVLYFQLCVWPWPLAIYHHVPLVETVGAAAPWLIPVALLAIGTIVLVWRRTAVGFVLATVFAILSPTLVVPVITEVAAERRMYLPLAALMSLAVVAMYCMAQRIVGDRAVGKSTVRPSGRALAVTCIPAALILLACTSASARRLTVYDDTLKVWQDALQHAPASEILHVNVGLELAVRGRQLEAIRHYEEAARLNPDSWKSYMHLGFAYLAAHRPQDALQQFQHVLKLEPDRASAHDNYGFALLVADRPRDALPEIEQAIKLDPNSAEARHNMGLVLAALERPQEAIANFQKALELNPRFTDAATNLGIAELGAGHPQEAVASLRRALELRPEQFQAVLPLATAYEALGQPAEAVRTVETALALARDRQQPDQLKQYVDWLRARHVGAGRP